MRTTLTIDDDLIAVAKSIAQAQGKTVGAAISELAWRGLNATDRVSTETSTESFPVFKVSTTARPITLEDLQAAEDQW